MDDSEENMSSDSSKYSQGSSSVKPKPKKRSLVERELETSLTSRITSPVVGEGSSTSRYGRARRLKTDTDYYDTDKAVTNALKSPLYQKTPMKSPSAYKMHAVNSPVCLETPPKDKIDNQIENIYNVNVSLSRFGSEEKNTPHSPAMKFPKVYVRKDLIQTKEKEEDETIILIKNIFSPEKSGKKPHSHVNNILERSSEKYNINGSTSKQNGYLDTSSVVKTLDFDLNKKKKKKENRENKTVLSKNELFELEAKCEYQVGDLAWARIGTFPFWPCIVTREPGSEMFVKKKLFGRIERDIVHVTFFGDNGRRSWVVGSMMRPFLGQLEFETTRDQFTPEAKKKDSRLYAAFFISEKKQSLWNASVQEAETLFKEPKRLRIDLFYDLLNKSRTSKVTPKGQKSGKISRTDSDVSLSESLFDSLFSEEDVKGDDIDKSRSKRKSLDVSEVVTACLDNMAAKTGIPKIQKQSHMDRWLQKAKSKTPEKSHNMKVVTIDKPDEKLEVLKSKDTEIANLSKKKKKLPLKEVLVQKPYSLRKSLNESNNCEIRTEPEVESANDICVISKIESLQEKPLQVIENNTSKYNIDVVIEENNVSEDDNKHDEDDEITKNEVVSDAVASDSSQSKGDEILDDNKSPKFKKRSLQLHKRKNDDRDLKSDSNLALPESKNDTTQDNVAKMDISVEHVESNATENSKNAHKSETSNEILNEVLGNESVSLNKDVERPVILKEDDKQEESAENLDVLVEKDMSNTINQNTTEKESLTKNENDFNKSLTTSSSVRRRSKRMENKIKSDSKQDPNFIKYLELNQDILLDQHPELSYEEIESYLHKTWLYEESKTALVTSNAGTEIEDQRDTSTKLDEDSDTKNVSRTNEDIQSNIEVPCPSVTVEGKELNNTEVNDDLKSTTQESKLESDYDSKSDPSNQLNKDNEKDLSKQDERRENVNSGSVIIEKDESNIKDQNKPDEETEVAIDVPLGGRIESKETINISDPTKDPKLIENLELNQDMVVDDECKSKPLNKQEEHRENVDNSHVIVEKDDESNTRKPNKLDDHELFDKSDGNVEKSVFDVSLVRLNKGKEKKNVSHSTKRKQDDHRENSDKGDVIVEKDNDTNTRKLNKLDEHELFDKSEANIDKPVIDVPLVRLSKGKEKKNIDSTKRKQDEHRENVNNVIVDKDNDTNTRKPKLDEHELFDKSKANIDKSGIDVPLVRRITRKEKKHIADSTKDPKFIKYLELNQDRVIDEHPELSNEDIVSYLHKTWLYEEETKTANSNTDDKKYINSTKNEKTSMQLSIKLNANCIDKYLQKKVLRQEADKKNDKAHNVKDNIVTETQSKIEVNKVVNNSSNKDHANQNNTDNVSGTSILNSDKPKDIIQSSSKNNTKTSNNSLCEINIPESNINKQQNNQDISDVNIKSNHSLSLTKNHSIETEIVEKPNKLANTLKEKRSDAIEQNQEANSDIDSRKKYNDLKYDASCRDKETSIIEGKQSTNDTEELFDLLDDDDDMKDEMDFDTVSINSAISEISITENEMLSFKKGPPEIIVNGFHGDGYIHKIKDELLDSDVASLSSEGDNVALSELRLRTDAKTKVKEESKLAQEPKLNVDNNKKAENDNNIISDKDIVNVGDLSKVGKLVLHRLEDNCNISPTVRRKLRPRTCNSPAGIRENGYYDSQPSSPEPKVKDEFDPESVSINSEDSNASSVRRRIRREKQEIEDKTSDPEFLRYLEIKQDVLVDEHPELTKDEIIAYLYKTWLYEEKLKSDVKKKADEIDEANVVKGTSEETNQVKKVKKKIKDKKKLIDINKILVKESKNAAEANVVKDKPKRKTSQPCYNEDFFDIEEEIQLFEIFRKKSKSTAKADIIKKENVTDKPDIIPKVELEVKSEPVESDVAKTEVAKPEPDTDSNDVKDIIDVEAKNVAENQIINADEYFDEEELYFEQLTQPKPNVFKGLAREKVCEICEKTANLVKCKGCNGMFHVDCVKRQLKCVEASAPVRGRKKKKKPRGRRPKVSTDSNGMDSESQSDEKSQDPNVSEEKNMSLDEPESHVIADAENFESQLEAKMKELLKTSDNVQYDSYSSDDGLTWSDTEAGKCKIVDIKLKEKHVDNTDYSDFKCNDCQKYDTPICFVCKTTVSPKTKTETRQRCHVAHCHKYYHIECLDHWPQTQFNAGEMSKNNKNPNELFEAVTCPRHVCHTCVCDDPRGCKTRFSGDKLARCVRCPATYHNFTKCLPAGTQILTASHIICPRHHENRPGKMPCHVNTGWCFICALGGSLICCEYCPTSFHAECLNISPPEGGYMCEDCETGRLPLYNEMVWVKLGHYRWWPGIILHPCEIPDNIMAVRHSPGEFVVRFFGQYDHYWVNRGRVFPFQEGDSGRISSQKSKIDEAFTIAMEHAQRAFEILKNIEENEEESLDIASSLLPPHYVKLKVNKPCGSLCGRKVDIEESSLTQCECDPNVEEPCGPYSHCLNRMLLTECGPICRAGELCQNRAFEKRQYPKMTPYRTPHRGWGLKTLEDIKAGQFVIEYVGELIDEAEFQRRMARKHEMRDENYYFLTLDKERMIDAGPKGNLARFMNHCCEPNCETQKWTVLGDVRVGLFALHDIPANSEVTFNYNLECAGIEKKRCLCGAKRCSGYMGAKPKQEEAQPKKPKHTLKRPYKKRKNLEESPSTSKVKPKRPIGRPPKPRELTEIEKDLLIIKNATNGLSSDSEGSGRLSSVDVDIDKKNPKALKRKRVSFSTDDKSAKKVKLDTSEVAD